MTVEQALSPTKNHNSADPEFRDIMRFRCGTLHENWYVAALSKEVGTKKPLARTIMDEPLVLFRNKAGKATALIDRCLHRNAKLSEGDLFDGCIGCPYHGWTYDTDGKCVFVPSEGPTSDGKQAEAAADAPVRFLERFPVREEDGYVWVYMGTPEKAADKKPFKYPEVKQGWKSYTMITYFDGDVTDLVENYMDVPHTAYVHAGWFRSTGEPQRCEADVELTDHSVLVTYHNNEDGIGFWKRIFGTVTLHTDKFYMPNCTRVDYEFAKRGYYFIITSQITPISDDKAVVYTAITYKFGVLNLIARLFLPWYTRKVIMQDVDIMEIQTANLERFGKRRFHSTEADLIHRSIEALREHAERGEVEPLPEPKKSRIAFWM